eukprot:GEMP01047217.1.p1 GENE.GEMP01047217.1~~GEMP01047217.1.p1  ORF type:complete len:438 (+),score=68.42 GEMP01047217.1:78-1391(+)
MKDMNLKAQGFTLIREKYPRTTKRWPERVAEIGDMARCIEEGLDFNLCGAAGSGKTVVLSSLLEEIDAHYVYVVGQEFLTLQGILHHMYDAFLEILKPHQDKLDQIPCPMTIDDFDQDASIAKFLIPISKISKKWVVLVFDRCRQVGGEALFKFFDNRDWRSRMKITNTSVIFVDEYDNCHANGGTIEFRSYTEDEVENIFSRLFPSHRKRENFFTRFRDVHKHCSTNFKFLLSIAHTMYADYCGKNQSIDDSMKIMYSDFAEALATSLSELGKLAVVAGFCCRSNPAEYDARFFKRDSSTTPVNKQVVENKILLANTLDPVGGHLPYSCLRFPQKPFKWCRFWAWITMLHDAICHGRPMPSSDDVRVLAIRPLIDARILETKMVDGIVMVQCWAMNKLAYMCGLALRFNVDNFIVAPKGADGRMRVVNRKRTHNQI